MKKFLVLILFLVIGVVLGAYSPVKAETQYGYLSPQYENATSTNATRGTAGHDTDLREKVLHNNIADILRGAFILPADYCAGSPLELFLPWHDYTSTANVSLGYQFYYKGTISLQGAGDSLPTVTEWTAVVQTTNSSALGKQQYDKLFTISTGNLDPGGYLAYAVAREGNATADNATQTQVTPGLILKYQKCRPSSYPF